MLVLSLPHSPKSEVFFVQTSAKAMVTQSLQAPMSLLPQGEDEVVGVLPWQRVSWHLIQVPHDAVKLLLSAQNNFLNASSYKSKAEQLLQGLLEEQLLDDLSALHWIGGKVLTASSEDASLNTAQAPLWVACCDKAWLQGVLSALEEHGLSVHRLVPEFEPSMQSVHLYALDAPMGLEFVLTQSTGVMGFPRLALSAFTAALSQPFQVHFEPSVSDQVSPLFEGGTQLQTRAQRLIEASQSSWDFARGEWGQSAFRRYPKLVQKAWQQFLNHKDWQLARLGLALLVLLNVLGLNAWTWHEQANLNAKKDELSTILKTTFSEVQVVVDPLAQMRRGLEALKQKTATPSRADFEHLLSAFSTLSAANPALDLAQIQQLRFNANELILVWKSQASSIPSASLKMPADLKAQGYEVFSQGAQTHLRWSAQP